MATIHIKSTNVNTEDGKTTVSFCITVKDEKGEKEDFLQYTLDEKYSSSLTNNVADSVVVTLLSYALRGEYDIVSDLPMTEKLQYTLTHQLIPQLATCNKIYQSKIVAESVIPDWNPKAVATAMSCGVDSFTTFYEYSQPDIPKNYRITHLTFFQNGAHHSGHVGHSEKEQVVYNEQLQWVEKFCKKNNHELIVISSNVDEFLSKMFWEDSYDNTHTYRNAGFVLLLQKLIRIYYYSPAYNISELRCSLTQDSATYERLILPNISTEYTTIYNSSGAMTRIEKIKYLSHFTETFDSILVCYTGGHNCGECIKCKRTLAEMDVSGVLDKYSKSFNLDKYMKERKKILVWCLSKRHNDELMRQIDQYIKENRISMPFGTYILSDIRMFLVDFAKIMKIKK